MISRSSFYTSGTTGPPKGAMLSHRNILFQLEYADFLTPPRPGDQQLSFLPLCHVAERTFSVFNPLRSGATVNFAERLDTVPTTSAGGAGDLLRRAPDLGEVLLRGRPPHARRHRARPAGLRVGHRGRHEGGGAAAAGPPPGLALTLLHRLADLLVLDNVKRSLGLHRARAAAHRSGADRARPIKW